MRPALQICLVLALVVRALADPRVAVIAKASPEYTARKFGDGKAQVESYVFMQGHYFEGATVDHSVERTPFRNIAEYLGVELSRQNYVPARAIKDAQLLIVVHWGTTIPAITNQEASGLTSFTTDLIGANAMREANLTEGSAMPPAPDNTRTPEPNETNDIGSRLIGNLTQGNSAQLLGYNEEVRRTSKKAMLDVRDEIMGYDLTHERYFITLIAYDLREVLNPGQSRHKLWSVNLNISSPGNNFQSALDRMSVAAVDYFGRTTDGLETVRPGERHAKVTIAPFIILEEDAKRK